MHRNGYYSAAWPPNSSSTNNAPLDYYEWIRAFNARHYFQSIQAAAATTAAACRPRLIIVLCNIHFFLVMYYYQTANLVLINFFPILVISLSYFFIALISMKEGASSSFFPLFSPLLFAIAARATHFSL